MGNITNSINGRYGVNMKNRLMKNFDGEKVAQECVEWIRQYAKENNMRKVVLGISGGKDSTVAAMICCEALGKDNVVGILMPNGNQSDIADSHKVCDTLGITKYEVNIGNSYGDILHSISASVNVKDAAKINVGPRLRMTVLYTIAQSIGARVCGTGNLSERTIGYCTKWGDMASDFNPLGNLTSLEVIEIGLVLAEKYNMDKSLIVKVPSDGYGAKNDSANTFFKMAMDNLKSIVDNTEYDSVWFNRESLEACQNELNKLNMTGVFYELKKLIANGLRYSIMEEIGHLDKITEELFMNLLIEEINS